MPRSRRWSAWPGSSARGRRSLLSVPASAAFFLAILSTVPARAVPNRPRIAVRLSYEAPSGARCPERDEVALLLAGEFGYSIVDEDAISTLSIRVRRKGAGFEAALDARDLDDVPRWERMMPNQWTCRELLYDAALLIRIALGPRGWGGAAEPPAWLSPPVEVGSSAPAVVPARYSTFEVLPAPRIAPVFATVMTTPGTEKEEGLPVHMDLGAGFRFSPFGMSGVGLGGAGFVGVRWSVLRARLEFSGLTSLTRVAVTDQGGGVDVSLFGASLVPCAGKSWLHGCIVIGAGFWQLLATAPTELRQDRSAYASLGLRFASELDVTSRFALGLHVDLGMTLKAPAVRSADSSPTAPPDWVAPLFFWTIGIDGITKIL